MSESAGKKLLKAAWVFTAADPLQRDGGVIIANGRIEETGDAKTLERKHRDAHLFDFGAAIILPGLINAHTHLELSESTPGEPAASFVDWILRLQTRRADAVGRTPEEMYATAVSVGVEQCLRFGVTTVGDISQRAVITRAALADTPIRAVSYGEVLGMARLKPRFDRLLEAAIDTRTATARQRIGLTPHAPFTVDLEQYKRCVQLAIAHRIPLATHLAENPEEREFLEHRAGPFRRLFETLGEWDDGITTFRGSPIEMAKAVGLLDQRALLAHVNYCDNDELLTLASGNASVVYCPRTHRYFRHRPHRWRDMLAAGINVAAGTDSCASSPDLNLVDDLRLLHEIAPEFPADQLWEMATVRAAGALRWEDDIGSIAPEKSADFTIFDVSTDSPLTEILESGRLPSQVWIRGNPVSPC